MMKIFKKIITAIFSLTMLATCSLSTSAYNSFNSYKAYEKYTSSLIDNGFEINTYGDSYIFDVPVSFIKLTEYNSGKWQSTSISVDFITENIITTHTGYTDLNIFYVYDKTSTPSEEEVKAFISDNNIKAEYEKFLSADEANYGKGEFHIIYDEDITYNEIMAIRTALNEEFGFVTIQVVPTTSKTITFVSDDDLGTPTIAGDVDKNGAIGIADIAKISKYTSNAELFPITDPTALANADITQDGVIDSLDTNMLIEIALGTYESAV